MRGDSVSVWIVFTAKRRKSNSAAKRARRFKGDRRERAQVGDGRSCGQGIVILPGIAHNVWFHLLSSLNEVLKTCGADLSIPAVLSRADGRTEANVREKVVSEGAPCGASRQGGSRRPSEDARNEQAGILGAERGIFEIQGMI